ncbi:MAG: hypothetical protein RLZZ408_132 [Verrucomicrobiota bacterium]|jgi:hypothetical protein
MILGPLVVALVLLSSCPLLVGCHRDSAPVKALVVTGLTADEEDAGTWRVCTDATVKGLKKKGVQASNIRALPDSPSNPATRESILKALQGAESLGENDEFWLVLYGYCGTTIDSQPAYQVRGERLTASDLKKALSRIKARKFVFLGTSQSGGFLPFLRDSRTCAVSATAEEFEINKPRYPEFWSRTLESKPELSFRQTAVQAASLVADEYRRLQFAEGEHSRILGENGIISDIKAGTDSIPSQPNQPK